ncbi:MAG: hypothetical protein ACOCRK_06325, partial [bacterium]
SLYLMEIRRRNYMDTQCEVIPPTQKQLRFDTCVLYDELNHIVKYLEGKDFIEWLKKQIKKRDKYHKRHMTYENRLGSEYWDSDNLVRPTRPNFNGVEFINEENNIEIDFNFKDGYNFKMLEYIRQYCMYKNPFKLRYDDNKTSELIMTNVDIKFNGQSQYEVEKELYFEFIVNEPIEVTIKRE